MAYGNTSYEGDTVRLLLWPLGACDWGLSVVVALRLFLPPPLAGDMRDENDEDKGDASVVRPDAGKSARALPFDFMSRPRSSLPVAW